MPEYLSPGVYLEEFEIGAKPIEGASTSTAGFLGMTERGPLNQPTLVTSFAEYQRIFGGYLNKDDYGDKRFLPYAVEGFFSNGGQRVYVSRVADTNKATCASGSLPNITGEGTILDEEVKPKAIMLKIKEIPSNLSEDTILILKDGPLSEILTYVGTAKALTLNDQLKNPYDNVNEITKMEKYKEDNKEKVFNIDAKVEASATTIKLTDIDGLKKGDVIYIEDDGNSEICIIERIPTKGKNINVKSPLKQHEKDLKLYKYVSTDDKTKLLSKVQAGYTVIPIDVNKKFITSDIIKIGEEYFYIVKADAKNVILIVDEIKYPHKNEPDKPIELKKLVPAIEIEAANEGSWGNSLKIVIKESSISKTKLKKMGTDKKSLDLETVTGIENGTILRILIPDSKEPPTYATVSKVIKTDALKRVELYEEVTKTWSGGKTPTVETIEFNLKVSYNEFEEIFPDLSLHDKHSRYIKKIITNETSNLIKVKNVLTSNGSEGKVLLPTNDDEPGWKLGGTKKGIGIDGIPEHESDLNEIYAGTDSDEPEERKGLHTLKNIDDCSIVAIPGITTQHLQNMLTTHCAQMKDRFAVLDSKPLADLKKIEAQRNLYDSEYAALYYPWISVFDPLSKKPTNVPPCGYICGIYARSDTERGVHKAPANEVVRGALDLEVISDNGSKRIITKGQQDILNPKGVNCIRAFPGRGIRVWGARTISSDSLWKYINVRRLFIYVEGSIEKGTQWVVFEPNDEKLWARVRATITQFLTGVWRSGALMGTKAEGAFFVKCDRSTMTQDDIDNGRLICVIGIAPVKPAEFVIFRIAQWTGGSTE